MSLPILTQTTQTSIQHLLGTHQERSPLPNSGIDMMNARLSIVTDVNAILVDNNLHTKFAFTVDEFVHRGGSFQAQVLKVFCDGTPTDDSSARLPVEAAVFSNLFPHGNQ